MLVRDSLAGERKPAGSKGGKERGLFLGSSLLNM